MDFSDDGSDSEAGAANFEPHDFSNNPDNPTSQSNILKPQIDRIFSEVQKNLPNIDFDSSDVSSDNDEPIFFHQNLKLSSLNAAFDDDKDLDTSLSQGDAPMLGLGMSIRGGECVSEGNDADQRPTSEHGNETTGNRNEVTSAANPFEAALGSSYDNDLAALMMQVKFPSADDVLSWQRISLKREEEEEEMYRREEEDLQKYTEQRQKLSSQSKNAKTADVGTGTSETGGLDIEEIDLQLSSSTQTEPDTDKTVISSPRPKTTPEFSATEKSFKDRLHQGIMKDLSSLGPQERKQVMREQARTKDQEIVSSLNPDQQTMLNFRLFEELDLDSILSAANESNIPLNSLRVVGRPDESQIPKSHDGGGDRSGAKAKNEELTLMQKLAQLSMVQRGASITPASNLDPKTGTPLVTADDSRLIYNQAEAGKKTRTSETGAKFGTTSSGSGPDPLSHTGCQTVFKTSSAGTSTASGIDKAKILYGRLRHEKKDSEPATVFIDLRGFEQKKEEEKQGLQSVQRVLGLGVDQGDEESSSSDDDEEMVERCNWRQTRQQLKQNLSEHGAAAAANVLGSSGHKKTGAGKTNYPKPPRVINLQEHAISRKWAGKTNIEQGVSEEARREHEEAVRKQEEDNKILQEKLEAEREKTRQREEAKRLREEREKERERRVRMSKQIDAARSTASTQGRQDAGENTPSLFDTEVSYEPAPSTLPPNLSLERETLLLTIHLSSNGEIVQHRKRSNRSVDTGSGLSATYTALLSWLLSLVPHDFSFLGGGKKTETTTEKTSNSAASTNTGSSSSASSSSFSTLTQPSTTSDLSLASSFNVLGLQQTWQDEELKLNVVVTPSESFYRGMAAGKQGGRSSKGKSDQMKGSSKFGQHLSKFLTVNTLYTVGPWLESLVSVVMKSERPEDKSAQPYLYTPPLPDISTKPLSTFIQINQDPQAARKIFNIPVGFYWQTVDTGEAWHTTLNCRDSHISYETQNTMSLVYNEIFHNPLALMAILNRVAQEGLDLAGVRLLYPSADMLASDHPSSSPIPTPSSLSTPFLGPVLALALRGTFARTIWLDAVGPSDPCLARRTDPNSLCAQFGGESRERALLFCPRNPSRVQSELTRWFGGRVSEGVASVDVGIPYTKKEEGRSKKAKKVASTTPTSQSHEPSTQTCQRPPAALSATCKSDVFLVLSPLLPPSYLGVVMATAQRRGFQVRGVRRIRLSARLANTLGISSSLQSLFYPGARLEEYQEERPVEALAPSTVVLLRKENATHNVPSLIEAFMVQLTLAGLLGCVQMRLEEPLKSDHLFHAATFSDSLLAGLGGELSKSPNFDLSSMRLSSSLSNMPANKRGVEQMTVVILLGHEMLKKCGVITSKLLNVLPFSTKTPVTPVLPDRPELLGLKWTPGLTMHQAKELSPYEIGDRRWRASVKQLASEPALALALRGVDIFSRLRPIIEQQQQQQQNEKNLKRTGKSSGSSQTKCPEVLMSHSASESDVFARLFFLPHELYPDPLARSLLPFLPEARLYFNIVDKEGENGGPPARLFSLKPPEELDLTYERVLDEVVAGQQPISTLLLVKPQATERYLSRVLRKVLQEQFRLVGLRMVRLTRDQAERLVPASQRTNSALCQQHVDAMTSGPSLVLVLQQPGAVKRLLDLLGPEDPQSARRLSQFLWRGEFGRDAFNNGLYCSSTYIDAVEDIKVLFPDGLSCEESELLLMEEIPCPGEDSIIEVCSNLKREAVLAPQHFMSADNNPEHKITVKEAHEMLLQTTCLVLTPPLVQARFKGKDLPAVDILAMLLKNGFELVGARMLWLTQRQAETFLAVQGGGSFQQVGFLCSGPCLVLAAQRDNAVLAFDSILNQTSESLRLMREHGDLILRPTSIKQAHALLAFLFDHLMPSSQLVIRPVTQRDNHASPRRDNDINVASRSLGTRNA